MTDLTFRILQLAHRFKRAHIGSALTAAPILDEIYTQRKPDEPVILSAGHAFLGLAVVLEKHLGHNAAGLLAAHGVHPTKSAADQIWCSTGSLGQGLSVAVGRALADRKRRVWVYITDGECAEGVVYEALSFAGRAKLDNLKVYCGWNGWAAYRESHGSAIYALQELFPVQWEYDSPAFDIPFLKGQDAHYHVMTEQDWEWVLDERVGQWHSMPENGVSLHQFLGMSWEEYGRWVVRDDLKIGAIVQTIDCPGCDGRGEHYMAMHSPPILIGCSRCGGRGRVRL